MCEMLSQAQEGATNQTKSVLRGPMLPIHTVFFTQSSPWRAPGERAFLQVLTWSGKEKMVVMLKIRGSLERCEPGREASGEPTGLTLGSAGTSRCNSQDMRPAFIFVVPELLLLGGEVISC